MTGRFARVRFRSRRASLHCDEEGQALAIVLGISAVVVLVPAALVVTTTSSMTTTTQESFLVQAEQAAKAGITDYINRVEASANESYASNYCSKTTFSACSKSPDPSNPAYQDSFDSHCSTSAWNVETGDDALWQLDQGTGTGVNSEFQYLVDTHMASSGYVWIYSTGRAGTSGHYACATQRAALKVTTTQAPPPSLASCDSTVSYTIPGTGSETVTVTLNGAGGGTGGSSGILGTILLPSVAGSGGNGQQVTASFSASAGSTIYVVLGCAGSTTTGGSGFAGGGDSTQSGKSGRGGGGGGASGVCLTSTCNTSTSEGDVLAIAGGGGGGGEGICMGSQGGAGGAGGAAGGAGYLLLLGQGALLTGAGGAAGSSGTWNPSAMAGSPGQTARANLGLGRLGSDGGGGGGGFAGGGGGAYGTVCGGGGGGGGGESWVNSSPNDGFALSGSPGYSVATTSTASAQISVTSSGQSVASYAVGGCGSTASSTTYISYTGSITVQMAGGAGSNGSDNGGWLLGGSGAQGGKASEVTATIPVTGGDYLYFFLGCPAYGYGSGSGGAGWSAGGSGVGGGGGGGGASAICMGQSATAPTAGNCTSSGNSLLLVAGGGGGGGETTPTGLLCTTTANGGNGGAAGTTASGGNGSAGTGSGAGAGGAGGTSGSGSLGTTAASGSGGGGGGGGGYGTGGAGGASVACSGLLSGASAGGGGAGGSWVVSSATNVTYASAPGSGGTVSITSYPVNDVVVLASAPTAVGDSSW